MLLPNVLLTDDVNAFTSTSTSTSTTAPTTTTSTHVSFDSLPPFNSNSNTFNSDVSIDDSPKHQPSNAKNQMVSLANELMTMTTTTTMSVANIAKPTSSIDCVKRFPVFESVDEAKRLFHFPTKNPENQNCQNHQKLHIINVDLIDAIERRCQLCLFRSEPPTIEQTEFPIFTETSTSTTTAATAAAARKEFPVGKRIQNFRSSIFVENNILGLENLPFFNDLNMPQATTAAAMPTKSAAYTPATTATTITTTTTTVNSTASPSTKIITHATDLATAAAATALIYEQMEHNGQGAQRQEAQVHSTQVQHNDQEQRAAAISSNNGSAVFHNEATTLDDGIGAKKSSEQPTGAAITMDKNSKLENASVAISGSIHSNNKQASEQFMNVCCDGCCCCCCCCSIESALGGQMDTHKNEQIVTINGNANVPLACDVNDAFENLNIEPKTLADRRHSDVRDTSSKEVLAATKKTAASEQCGTFEQPKVNETETDTATPIASTSIATARRQPSKSSFSLDVLTSHAVATPTPTPPATTRASVHDKLPNFELLPNYYALELVESNARNWTETIAAATAAQPDKWLVDLDRKARNSNTEKTHLNKSDVKYQQRVLNALPQQIEAANFKEFNSRRRGDNQQLRRAFSEMTLTKIEEHDDGATQLSSSEPPSPVLSLSGEQLLSHTLNGGAFDEMKFEMRATKGLLPPPSTLHDSLKHERFSSGNLPASTPSTTAPPSTATSTSLLRLSQQPNTNAKSLPTKSLARSQSSTLTEPTAAYPELRYSTRLSMRPANEAVALRENEVSRSASVDAINAVLPTRTQLRRQRRMASQDSVGDKDEDPIERLNRLRARISGALSEVKGVLNKYSTETEPANEPAATTKTAAFQNVPKTESAKPVEEPGPVQFRFVRKVRRRSIFLEEDEANEKSGAKGEAQLEAQPKSENLGQEKEHLEKAQNKNKESESTEKCVKASAEEYEKIEKKEVLVEAKEPNKKETAVTAVNEHASQTEKSTQLQAQTKPTEEAQQIKEKAAKTASNEGAIFKSTQQAIEKQLQTLEKESHQAKSKEKEQPNEQMESIKTQHKEAKVVVKDKHKTKCTLEKPKESEKLEENAQINEQKELVKAQHKATDIEENKDDVKEKSKLQKSKEKQQPEVSAEKSEQIEPLKEKKEKVAQHKEATTEVDNQAESSEKFLPEIKINKAENSAELSTVTANTVRMRKKPISRLEVDTKEINRRASTGAIKEATIPEALELQTCKTQRRPSDSAALNEAKSMQQKKAEEKRKTFKTAKKSSTSVDGKLEAAKVTDDAEKANKAVVEPPKSKKRATLKRGDSLRRASIAAVEKSKIEPPLEDSAAQALKAERRASDATVTAAVKQPSTAKSKLITRRPTPKVKAGAKVKRSSLILQESAASALSAVDESMATTTTSEHTKDANTIDATSIKVIDDAPTATLSSSAQSTTLSTALSAVIDRAATTATANAIVDADTIKNSEKIAIKAIGQSVAIAVPTSLAQTNVANSRVAHATSSLSSSSVDNLGSPKKGTTIIDANVLINQQKLSTPEKSSTTYSVNATEAAKVEDIKKPIHQQQKNIPAPSSSPSTSTPTSSTQLSQQCIAQQVAVSATVLGALVVVPEIESKAASAAQQPASEVKCSSESAVPIAAGVGGSQLASDAASTKVACLAVESNSGAQTITTASASVVHQQANKTPKTDENKMPELQILPAPVKAVQIPAENRKFAPLNLPREELPKQKKIIFKKIVRQKSTEKQSTAISKKPTTDSTVAIEAIETNESDLAKDVEVEVGTESEPATETVVHDDEANDDATTESPVSEQPPAPPKKPRKIKKKVIIKRQQRRLSITDQTFFNSDINNDELDGSEKPVIETLEKAIAYVTDDDDDDENAEDEAAKDALPLKGCMRQREFEIGEAVLYAERYKRTQVRWKKGRVLERITSISYKLEIEGKEVAAHISYIKRYTDRKVSFGGKEYLEIDYEQIAEETEKPRSYSIWNMV